MDGSDSAKDPIASSSSRNSYLNRMAAPSFFIMMIKSGSVTHGKNKYDLPDQCCCAVLWDEMSHSLHRSSSYKMQIIASLQLQRSIDLCIFSSLHNSLLLMMMRPGDHWFTHHIHVVVHWNNRRTMSQLVMKLNQIASYLFICCLY